MMLLRILYLGPCLYISYFSRIPSNLTIYSWSQLSHIGRIDGSHESNKFCDGEIYLNMACNNRDDYCMILFHNLLSLLLNFASSLEQLCILDALFFIFTLKLEETIMRGDKMRLELDKTDEFKAKPTIWFVYTEGDIDKFMESMKGNDEILLKQFVASWEDRRVTMGGISFEVNEDMIAQSTSLSMEGTEWKKQSHVSDTTSLNQFFRDGENPVKQADGFNCEEIPPPWDDVCYIMKYFTLEGRYGVFYYYQLPFLNHLRNKDLISIPFFCCILWILM